MDEKPKPVDVSVVIPVYNEEGNLKELYAKLTDILPTIAGNYEIIFVDDGSTDNSFNIFKEINDKDKNVKAIKLRRNFGQTAAIQAGFDHAKGAIVVTMDGDLQNDPEDIPRLVKRFEDGYDVVSGWRYNRKDPLGKKISSKISNWLANKLTGLNLHDFGCTLKAYKKEAVNDLTLYGEMHRYIPALISMKGFSICEVKVEHRQRKYGTTKYTFKRLWKGFFDLMYIKFWLDFSTRPLHFFGFIGFLNLLGGFVIVLYKVPYQLLYLKRPVEAGPLLMLSVLLVIIGLLFIVFGFLCEIQIRTYYESIKKRPYEIKKIL